MIKYILLIMLLVGCSTRQELANEQKVSICIEGVSYWNWNTGYAGVLAPRYQKSEEPKLVLCNE